MANWKSKRSRYHMPCSSNRLDSETRKYIPLFGVWLLDIALALNWYKPRSPRHLPEVFDDTDFCAMTDMAPLNDDTSLFSDLEQNEESKPITALYCRKLLLTQRVQLKSIKLSLSLPLFKNIKLLSGLLDLTEADKAVLMFAAGLNLFPGFENAVTQQNEKISTPSFCRLMAKISGIKEDEFHLSFAQDSPLVTSGLIKVDRRVCDLELKVTIMPGFGDVIQARHKNVDDLMTRFMKRAASPSLTLDNFPHLKKDGDLLKSYLSNALTEKTTGVNVLFHGKPGVGKNEFVQALASELNVDLYEVSYADQNGDPIKGEERLRAYALCQKLLARSKNTMLLFDEIEDVFGCGSSMLSLLLGTSDDDHEESNRNGKAWVNRTLESNPVPSIWISNRIRQIDKAYLRRFDLSVCFPTPPHGVRVSIARHHLGCFNPTQSWIERIAANEAISPAQFERAAKVARIASAGGQANPLELVEQSLDRSITLLGQSRTPSRNLLRTGYSLEWLNTDLPIHLLVEGLKKRPRGTFCFYGAAGTGKSELARHISDQIGKPLILKRASDIISKWVGESEKNIATMFAEARQQDAVLVLDEADSFLSDRRDAEHSWEVTQVNELLTQMEAFAGIFICTTNLMCKLDQASLRRFAFKVRFDPLKPDQRIAMFRQELVRLGGDVNNGLDLEPQLHTLEQLTPGYFAVAARQFELWDEPATPSSLFDALKKECEAKGPTQRIIGFKTIE